jgi:hypothetical protein
MQGESHFKMDVDNSLDVYWPIPNIYWSALPVIPIIKNIMQHFVGGPNRRKPQALLWLNQTFKNMPPPGSLPNGEKIELGIFGGHMNNHPIGQMVLYRLLVKIKIL